MSTKLIDHLATDYIFSNDNNGFNVAIAFTKFDNELDPILDKSYGELIFRAWEWGKNEKGEYYESLE